ncbi:hypothetical protein J4Q44_G00212210 [Coregonus suidteri]|uniref:Mitochondrial carrier 1 n=1 Tax=Coregonus suidteri TaxID=861788 RepID=A0AAN8LCY6_9TELE
MQLIPSPHGMKSSPASCVLVLRGITCFAHPMPYTVSEIVNIAENMVTTEDLSGETGARREPQFYRDSSTTALDMDTSNLLLGAGVTVITHPLLYVKLLIQIGHEPLTPTVGTTMFGRKVLYLPGFFSYAQHVVRVDGKRGLFRGLSPCIMSSAISTMVRSKVKQTIPADDVSNRDDLKTSLRKVVKVTSHEMVIQCLSRIATHPFHVISVRCMAQFVGREVTYSGLFSCITKIFKEEGVGGFFVGIVPHVLGKVIFLWCCNLLDHFINTYAVDDNFSQAPVIRSYTKLVMGIAVSVLTYPFMLVADLMAVNNCG